MMENAAAPEPAQPHRKVLLWGLFFLAMLLPVHALSTNEDSQFTFAMGYDAARRAQNSNASCLWTNSSNTTTLKDSSGQNVYIDGTLNVSVEIKQGNVNVCLEDGTNCPSGNGMNESYADTLYWRLDGNNSPSLDDWDLGNYSLQNVSAITSEDSIILHPSESVMTDAYIEFDSDTSYGGLAQPAIAVISSHPAQGLLNFESPQSQFTGFQIWTEHATDPFTSDHYLQLYMSKSSHTAQWTATDALTFGASNMSYSGSSHRFYGFVNVSSSLNASEVCETTTGKCLSNAITSVVNYTADEVYIDRNASDAFVLNESKLNLSIDARMTNYTSDDVYIDRNASDAFVLNVSRLNLTIIDGGAVYNDSQRIIWANTSETVTIKNDYAHKSLNVSAQNLPVDIRGNNSFLGKLLNVQTNYDGDVSFASPFGLQITVDSIDPIKTMTGTHSYSPTGFKVSQTQNIFSVNNFTRYVGTYQNFIGTHYDSSKYNFNTSTQSLVTQTGMNFAITQTGELTSNNTKIENIGYKAQVNDLRYFPISEDNSTLLINNLGFDIGLTAINGDTNYGTIQRNIYGIRFTSYAEPDDQASTVYNIYSGINNPADTTYHYYMTGYGDMWIGINGPTNGGNLVFGTGRKHTIYSDNTDLNLKTTGGAVKIINSSGWGQIEYGNAIDHTTPYDYTIGDALDNLPDFERQLNPDGSVNHSALGGPCAVDTVEVDYTRPVVNTTIIEVCVGMDELNTCNSTMNRTVNKTEYPYTRVCEKCGISDSCRANIASKSLSEIRSASNVVSLDNSPALDTNTLLVETLLTKSKVPDNSTDYTSKLKDIAQLSNKSEHYAHKNVQVDGINTTTLDLEERIITLEGALSKVLTETCAKNPNEYSWCTHPDGGEII